MKYFYPFILLLLSLMTAFNYVKLHVANGKIEKFDKIEQKLQLDSRNYLSSLTSTLSGYSDLKILLQEGDTITPSGIDKSALFFVFSPRDCMTCVEENVFEVIKLAKTTNSFSLYIVTTKENRRYIELLRRSNDQKNINYGICINKSEFLPHHYFIVSKNGEISNTYYPEKGNFDSTQRYLEYVKEKLCSQNLPDNQSNR